MKHYYDAAKWYDMLCVGLPGEMEFYVREAKRSRGRVLELACGTGRIYLELLSAGVDAYGLDLAGPMLQVLKEKGERYGLGELVNVKKGDMRTFRYPFKFDLVIIPYRTFNHLETREDQKKCLMNIHRHLKKGGRLILNFFDPKVGFLAEVDRKTTSRTVMDQGKKIRMEDFSHFDLASQRITVYHRLLNPPAGLPRGKIRFSLAYIFPREFMNMLELCGFKDWELYGGFEKRPYTKHGQELVWIARK
jgi:SAM-dependent methyltransferase